MLSYYDIKNIIRGKGNSTTPVDDFRIIDSYAIYDEKKAKKTSERKLEYLCYEIESINPETGEKLHFYKALKFARVIRLPKAAKQSTSFIDIQQQILSGVWEGGYNMVTIIANIINPVPLGLLFLYGVQGVGDTIEKAKAQADHDYIGLTTSLQGSFYVLEMRTINAQETEWLREKMFNMNYMTVVRGIPKAAKGGVDMGNKGIGGKNLNPDSQGTLEEFIAGMADYEYVVQVLSTPVYRSTLREWNTQTEKHMSDWNSQLQGTKALSFNISMPMMYVANQSSSQGWSKAYTDADSVTTSIGESFSTGYGESVSESLSRSFSESYGLNQSQSVSESMSHSQSISNGITSGQTIGQTIGQTQGVTMGHTEGMTLGETRGQTLGETLGQTLGQTQGQTLGQTQGHTVGTTEGQTYGQTFGQTIGQSYGQNASVSSNVSQSSSVSQGQSINQSISSNVSDSHGTTSGQSYSQNFSETVNQSHTVGQSQSFGQTSSESIGMTNTETQSQSMTEGQSLTASNGWSNSTSKGHTDSNSVGSSFNHSESDSFGTSSSTSANYSYGKNESEGTNSGGSVTPMGLGGNWGSSSSEGSSWSASMGTSNGTSETHGTSNGWGISSSQSSSDSVTATQGTSGSISAGSSISETNGLSQSESLSHTQSNSMSNTFGSSESYSASNGYSAGESFGLSESVSHSQSISNGTSQGWGQSITQSQGITTGQGYSQGTSMTDSISNSASASQSNSISNSMSDSISNSTSNSLSNSMSNSMSNSVSNSASNSLSNSVSNSRSDSLSNSISDSISHSQSVSQSMSEGVTTGKSVGTTQGQSYTQGTSQGTSEGYSQSQNVSQGTSQSQSVGKSQSVSTGMSGASVAGASSSMGFGPSIGYNKSYQWLDQQVKDILELLEFQNERIKKSLRGEGAFYTYVYIACPSQDALAAAQAVAKTTWQNEYAMINPLQVLKLSSEEQKHLLYHFAAFSNDVTREDVAGVKQYKYCTVLLPHEFVAYNHLPRISEGGVFADVNDIPKFAVPSGLKGEIYMGTILSAERYTMQNGYSTPFDYRIDESELMHGFFTGASRSGKTVAAMRFVAELANVRRKDTGKRLRIVCMDPKQDWRTLARFVDPERFRFYSLGNASFRPIKINPFKIPYGVVPQTWIDGVIDIFCRAYGLLERGKQMMGETIYALYEDAGVFKACDNPDWKEVVPNLSKEVTFPKVYKKMSQLKASLEDPTNPKGRAGNDTRDAYARLLDRLQCFNREFSIEYKLFGTSDGLAIDEMIGADDVTVLESSGLEKTFKNFIFGVITSGFYKSAKAHEGGFLAHDQYETVLVIEEANEVLIGNDCAGSGSGASMGMTVSGQSEFEEILDQSAGYGLFIIAITQKIADMPKSIIANSGLVFAGRLKTQDDVTVVIRSVAREERYDDRDLVKWFPRMATGMFVCQRSRTFDFKDAEPILVQIARLNAVPPSNLEIDEILTQQKALQSKKDWQKESNIA